MRSELIYFDAGARVASGPGWHFAAMPGLGPLTAAAVAFLDGGATQSAGLEKLISRLEAQFLAAGADNYRFYTQAHAAEARRLLTAKGYAARTEIISVRPIPHDGYGPHPGISAVPIIGDAEWNARLGLQYATDASTDGRANAPELWVEMERRKCQSGRMKAFLFRKKGEVVATAGLILCSPVTARLKNVLVHQDHRRQGIGSSVVELLSAKGQAAGAKQFVTFAISDSIGEELYPKLGFRPVGGQVEWVKPVSGKGRGQR